MNNQKVNWDRLITADTTSYLKLFASNTLSGRQASSIFKNTEYAGEFRNLIRDHGGVTNARKLTKRALQRRKLI